MKIRNQNLYIVEFGKPDRPGSYSYGGDYVYVLADDAGDAAKKAQEYMVEHHSPIITADGSLGETEVETKNIKIMSNKIIY